MPPDCNNCQGDTCGPCSDPNQMVCGGCGQCLYCTDRGITTPQ